MTSELVSFCVSTLCWSFYAFFCVAPGGLLLLRGICRMFRFLVPVLLYFDRLRCCLFLLFFIVQMCIWHICQDQTLTPVCSFVSKESQNVKEGFRRHLVDRLGVWQGRIDYILVHVRIRMCPTSGIQNVNCSAWWRYALYQMPFSLLLPPPPKVNEDMF